MIGSSVMKELMFTKIDPCLNVSRICSVSIRFPHPFSLCVVYFYESVFSIYLLKVKLQALLTLPKVLLPHGVNLMGFFVTSNIFHTVFSGPPIKGEGEGSPLLLKLYFVGNFFLEIYFCVVLQGIQNFFGPSTPRISSGTLFLVFLLLTL